MDRPSLPMVRSLLPLVAHRSHEYMQTRAQRYPMYLTLRHCSATRGSERSLVRLLAAKLSIDTNDTPGRSVSKSESKAAMWAMDMGAVIGLMAWMAWQQSFERRCTHCAAICARRPIRSSNGKNENAPCMKKIAYVQHAKEDIASMHGRDLVVDHRGRVIVCTNTLPRCTRAAAVGIAQRATICAVKA